MWSDLRSNREMALHHCHQLEVKRLSEHTKRLPPLRVGDHIRLQYQLGNSPGKWDNRGVVIEVMQHDQ
jgi:hypothetical protein